MDAQADQSLPWVHMSKGIFSEIAAQMLLFQRSNFSDLQLNVIGDVFFSCAESVAIGTTTLFSWNNNTFQADKNKLLLNPYLTLNMPCKIVADNILYFPYIFFRKNISLCR